MYIAFMALIIFGFVHANFGDYTSKAYYSISFDDRGLANVGMRLDYIHLLDQPTDHINLNIPGTQVKIITAFIRTQCGPNIPVSDYPVNNNYAEGCSYDGYRFVLAEVVKVSEGSYRIMLNSTLAKGDSTSIIVYYRAFGYVNDGYFGKNFAFQTIRNDFDIDYTRVSVAVDNGLILKEGGSQGNYRPDLTMALAPSAAVSTDSMQIQQGISSVYDSIEYASGYVKEKSTLFSGESFTVKGTYADNLITLYAPEIGIALLMVGGILFYLSKRPKKLAEPVKPANIQDIIIFAFVGAVVFAILSAIAYISISEFRLGDDIQIKTGVLLLGWILSIGLIYLNKKNTGHGTTAALLFIGFSILFVPIALIFGAIIANLLIPQYPIPYY